MSRTLHARLVAYRPFGERIGVLAEPVSFSASMLHNDGGAITIEYSMLSGDAQAFDRELTDGLEVAVEVSDGTGYHEPDNARFVITGRSGKTDDRTKTITYSGQSIGWLLSKAENNDSSHLIADGDNKGKRPFYSSNPGVILKTLLDENKARGGVATGLTLGFDTAKDAGGAAWARKYTLYYSLGTDLQTILSSLVNGGGCDWRTSGRTLKLWNADSTALSRDLSKNVVLQLARDIGEAPYEESIADLASTILVEGDNNLLFRMDNPAAPTPWGKWESFSSQGGVSDKDTAQAFMQSTLDDAARVRGQYTRALIINDVDSLPLVDYHAGDWITAPTVSHGEKVRVQEIDLSMRQGEGLSASLALNDIKYDASVRQAKKIKGITGGAALAGSESGTTASSDRDHRVPKAPLGLIVQTDAYIGSDGYAHGLATAMWSAVTEATDNTAIEISNYSVEWKLHKDGAPWHSAGTTDKTQLGFGGLDCGTQIEVRVRAVPTYSDKLGEWSEVSVVTVESDVTPCSVPSKPVLSSELGVVTVHWDGKTDAGASMEPDFDHIEVGEGVNAAGMTVISATQAGRGDYLVTGLEAGSEHFYALRSVDHAGNKSDWSAIATVTVASAVSPEEVERIQQDLAANKEVLKDNTAKLSQARKDIAANQAAQAATTKDLESAKSDIKANRAAITSANATLQDNTAKLSQAQKDIQANTQTIATANSTLAQARKDIQANSDSIKQTKSDLDAANSTLTQARKDIQANATALATAKSDLAATQSTLTQARKDIQANTQTIADTGKSLAQTQSTLTQAQKDISDAKQAAADAYNEAHAKTHTYRGPDKPEHPNTGDLWLRTQAFFTRWEGERDNSPSDLADFYTVWEGEPDNSPSDLIPLSDIIVETLIWDGTAWSTLGYADVQDNTRQIEQAKSDILANAAQTSDARRIAENASTAASNAQSTASSASTAASTAQSVADAAKTAAADAVKRAQSASTAANTASTTASAAASTASSASSAASTAASTAQQAKTTADTASTAASAARSAAQDAQTVANAASKAAASAQNTAENAQTLANTADATAKDANATASTAASNASTALSTAQSAAGKASDAASVATQAKATADSAAQSATDAAGVAQKASAAAANAAGIATGKADVLIQGTEPGSGMRKATTLWIDTTGGSNTPKKWSGSAWVAVTDKTATDAANTAAIAKSAAQTAQSAADKAQTTADNAQAQANQAQAAALKAQTTADGKNLVYRGATEPTHDGLKPGDLWWKTQAFFTRWEGERDNSPSDLADFYTVWEGEPDNSPSDLIPLSDHVIDILVWDGTRFNGLDISARDVIATGTVAAKHLAADSVTADKLAANAVTADKLAANAVTTVKLVADAVTADKLAANSVSARSIQSLAVTAGKLAVDSVNAGNIVSGAVTADKLAANSVTADKLAANSVTTAKLAAGAVNADRIAANAVTTAKIAAGAVTTSQLAANAVTADKVKAMSIGTDQLAANAVNAGKLAANSVVAGKLAVDSVNAGNIVSGAVTADKLAANAVNADKLAANSVTAGKVQAGAIGTDKLAANAVTTAKLKVTEDMTVALLNVHKIQAGDIVSGAVTTDKLAANAVNADKLAANSVNAGNIVSGAITADKLAANSVTAVKIAAGSITTDKVAAGQFKGYVFTGAVFQSSESADTGIKINSTALQMWDSQHNRTIYLDGEGKNNVLTGNFQTAASGNRIKIKASATAGIIGESTSISGQSIVFSDKDLAASPEIFGSFTASDLGDAPRVSLISGWKTDHDPAAMFYLQSWPRTKGATGSGITSRALISANTDYTEPDDAKKSYATLDLNGIGGSGATASLTAYAHGGDTANTWVTAKRDDGVTEVGIGADAFKRTIYLGGKIGGITGQQTFQVNTWKYTGGVGPHETVGAVTVALSPARYGVYYAVANADCSWGSMLVHVLNTGTASQYQVMGYNAGDSGRSGDVWVDAIAWLT
ncbi:hypothetical protein [Bifidobacterium boum]|uniref:hypothetical protein n=1 Tax=Bifidobacterium boum TaxID=78343 RepID=UPI00242D4A57|nr:hypothetical protein [Bifidobacterium boum]MCI5861965.1 hypothetical protein [Bifidobacterium boum]